MLALFPVGSPLSARLFDSVALLTDDFARIGADELGYMATVSPPLPVSQPQAWLREAGCRVMLAQPGIIVDDKDRPAWWRRNP